MTETLAKRLRVVAGDITKLTVDAIVTAANAGLLGGGGVDGAVHNAAGEELLAACRTVAPCPTGEARITPGFRLAASHVVHAVGPVYSTTNPGESQRLLASAYTASLKIAAEHGARSIAFPCISTGVYGYPADEACYVAVDAVVAWCRENKQPELITFCCFGAADVARYGKRLADLGLPE